MKLNPILGKGTGKLGALVLSVNSGVQIAREYNGNPANPSTTAQVGVRSKFKLISQLAATMAGVIAIPREGLISARNGFIKRNYDYLYEADGTAQISIENIQLTAGNAALPQILISRASSKMNVALAASATAMVSRVVYVFAKKTENNDLQVLGSRVVTEAGENGTFPLQINDIAGEVLVLGYGMKDMNAAATAKFGNMNVRTGEDIATLVASRTVNSNDYRFTMTRGTQINADGQSVNPTPSGQARVYVTASGPGTVSGATTAEIGTEVTVTATPNSGATFIGWKIQGQNNYVSYSASYTFTLQGMTDLVAEFSSGGGGGEGGDIF